ncbi:uncharacterized protein LOC143011680 [Genypterus blacodes]|uniref:uncharacterized protein LOC143011680 n=1 Tax=Genypterus blacodes TaxID=154954 RepID=UPI003F7688DD
MADNEAASPPALPSLFESDCRKRSCNFDDPEQQKQVALHRKTTQCNNRSDAASVSSVHAGGSPRDCCSSTTIPNAKKRARDDRPAPTQTPALPHRDGDRMDANSNSEDDAYNSFQFWRVPLLELDLSLLDDASDQSRPIDKSKSRDSCADAMET